MFIGRAITQSKLPLFLALVAMSEIEIFSLSLLSTPREERQYFSAKIANLFQLQGRSGKSSFQKQQEPDEPNRA